MKKGFTLIELLAVIVILAIIALIATPLILNVIDEATKGAFRDTAYGIVKAGELEYTEDILKTNSVDGALFMYVDGEEVSDVIGKTLDYTGTKPKNGMVGVNSEGKVALAVHNGSYCAEKGYNDNEVTLSEKTADECVISGVNQTDMSEFNQEKGVNKPKLAPGMTAIKWNENTNEWDEINDPENDTSWYDYNTKMWANAKTADGSMWVWIPRYIYKISSYWHKINPYGPGDIEVKFSVGTDDAKAGTVSLNTDTSANASNNSWTNHPAFTFGDTELTGIWIAKFEPSVANQSDACYTNTTPTNCNKTTLVPKIIPNARSWRFISLSNAFNVSRSMENNTTYGWGTSGTDIDTHMMKNTEWGVAIYLSASIYGQNKNRIWLNPYLGNTTGCAGDVESPPDWVYDCTNTYESEKGVKTSTTGNIYGIYDMRGNTYEATAAYINNGDSSLLTYGADIVNADLKYKDVYNIGETDSMNDNNKAAINKKGDAIYETSGGSTWSAWFKEFSTMPYDIDPWFKRGGERLSNSYQGVFMIGRMNGDHEYNHTFTYRPVLVVESGL